MRGYFDYRDRIEMSYRKHYRDILLNQQRIQDLLGVLEFVHQHTNGHRRFIESSLVLDTHILRLLREATLNDCSITLEHTISILGIFKIKLPEDDRVTKRWASQEVYRKMKGEDEGLPLHTKFSSLPRIQLATTYRPF